MMEDRFMQIAREAAQERDRLRREVAALKARLAELTARLKDYEDDRDAIDWWNLSL